MQIHPTHKAARLICGVIGQQHQFQYKEMERNKKLSFIGAIVFPIVVSIAVAQVIHLLGTQESEQIWFYPGLFIGVLLGVTFFLTILFHTNKAKYISFLFYLPLILAVSWVSGFIMFFINSDFAVDQSAL
jgi:hypothetical protein